MTATDAGGVISTPGARERVSTRVAFFIGGFGMAAWAPLIPYAQERLGVEEGALGLLLLCLGLGSIIMMPMAGALAGRFGCRIVFVISSLVICLSLPFLAVTASLPALALALTVFGAGLGAVDVVMNLQAVIVEKASGRSLMSGFHGLFSVGALAGVGCVSGLLWAGAPPLAATFCVAAGILALLAGFGRHLLPYGSRERDGASFAWPHGFVLFLGVLCFIVFLMEGAVLDWSAVFLTSERGVEPARSGLGYAAFALAMVVGRLSGDRLVQAIGPRPILVFGGLCAAAGLAIAVLAPSWIAAVFGFALVGLGASNVEPVLYTAVGRQTAMPQNLAVAAVTTLGYSGILAGPALIGFVAQATSLSFALLCVAAAALAISASSRIAIR